MDQEHTCIIVVKKLIGFE